MRIAIALAITVAAVSSAAAASSDPAAPPPHHRHHHHAASPAPEAAAHPNPIPETAAPAPLWPGFKPYPPGEGDEDGLSRDPDDCEKGCIGGNPG